MANFDVLLSRLDGVKRSGEGYVARCPAHDDRAPSLALRETNDGRVLLHCFAGCSAGAVLAAVGMAFEDVMPDAVDDLRLRPIKRPFAAEAILECVAREAVIVQICAADLGDRGMLSEPDRARLVTASGRLNEAVEMIRARS